jgi:hypothetical protein
MDDLLPRGIRNNNPCNLKFTEAYIWRGQIGKDDGGFVVFKSAAYGIRAFCMVMQHYERYLGCVTVMDYVYRFAPPPENNTAAYGEFIAKQLGLSKYDALPIHKRDDEIVKSFILYENGDQPYSDQVIADGISWSHIH